MKTPTKEQVLEAAKTSTEAKEALQKLFPEVFEDKYFDLSGFKDFKFSDNFFIERRVDMEYKNKSLYLDSRVNWEIKRDSHDLLCLIPTKKQ